ncbi:hypothetical protein HPULCUR_006009 [Helicostylum pulchrum]|uniref:Ras-GEF domain-containing protein n=1 Tax=Helicostylum pulchrum TaxID=562976 RepID=A0ABP9Y1Y0_9FUNG
MWISRKLAAIASPSNTLDTFRDRLSKPLPPLSGELKIEPLVIIVSGESNIGKSTFIRFGLQNLIAKHDSNRPDLQCHHTKILLDDINYPIDIIELNGSVINQDSLPLIHGGLICYDATSPDYLDSITDLSNYYFSRQIPAFIVGLKSDLTTACQIQPLVQQQFHVDAFSETGVDQMQEIFKLLVQQYYPRCVNHKQEVKPRHPIQCDNGEAGFIYAQTRTIDKISVTSGTEADPDKVLNENIASFSSSFHMTNKRGTFPSHLSSRRGSKDSSESFGIGLTTEDIVDRLLSTEYSKTDRISKYDSHTPICDSLAPLVVREPPTYDPDNVWGLVDDVQEEEPSTPIKRNEKKDSGYASGTFTFVPSSPTKSDAPPFTLKRLSSTTTQPPTLLSPNLNRILLRSHGKAVTHSGSHPDLKSSYAATSHHNTELPRRAEFAGGLINIDNATKQSYPPSSISRSLATTSGGRWTTSLGNQLLASSFISTFRQNKSEKDQAGHNYKLFIKASDTSIADQLTWIESELFSKIKSREFVRNIWNSPVNDNKRSSLLSCNNTVLASIAHFNFISAWVVTVIVTQSRLSKRVALLQKFMSIAVHLRNLNNYNTLMAILAGINSASVLRLKQTRQAILTKKIYKQFQSLEKLMSTDKSFSSYRMALKASSSGTPGIPYLGIHTQDLVSLAEANKDFRADGSIHWEKFRLMGETIMATMKFKCPSYTIEPDAKLLALIADTYILSEDDQYKMSTTVEPRLAPSSTNRIRDLWLRI